MRRRHAIILVALVIGACESGSSGIAACPTEVVAHLNMQKEAGFTALGIAEQATTSGRLIDCLGHPDPEIRDDLAYRGLAEIMRNGALPPDDLRALRDRLLGQLNAPDPDGFLHPFAALVLSEVARTDRITPYLTPDERSAMTDSASGYLLGVRDYRGFEDEEGWRHGVAHGADWLMQLSLNPQLELKDRLAIIDAVIRTVPASSGHAFIHGEPERLARPLLLMSMGNPDAADNVASGINRLADPAPYESWDAAFQTEDGLARIHNITAFLSAIYIAVALSENPAAETIREAVVATRSQLP